MIVNETIDNNLEHQHPSDETVQKLDQLFEKNERDLEGELKKSMLYIQDLESDLSEANKKLADTDEEMKRQLAEFQNSMRRLKADKEQALKFANEKFFKDFILILDSMDSGIAALQNSQGTLEQFLEGTQALNSQVLSALDNFGLKVVCPSQGDLFDPAFNEALATQPNPDLENNSILAVIQKGYTLNDRLLRPARVIVVKNN